MRSMFVLWMTCVSLFVCSAHDEHKHTLFTEDRALQISNEENEVLREENRLNAPVLKDTLGLPIHFGVVISTYPRENDHHYLLPRATAVRFLLRQTFSNWTIIMSGDSLNATMTHNLLLSLRDIPAEKLIFTNLPFNETERYMYTHRQYATCKTAKKGRESWCHAGTSAINLALRTAVALPHVTHIALLDDDDIYFPRHLEHAADVYMQYPEAHFTFSRGFYLGKPFPIKAKENVKPIYKYKVNHSTPMTAERSNSISSLWTWKLSNKTDIASLFYFQHDFTQIRRNPGRTIANKTFSYANDADLVLRVNDYILSRNLSQFAVFVPNIDGVAIGQTERYMCIERLNMDFEKGVDTDVVKACHINIRGGGLRNHLGLGK